MKRLFRILVLVLIVGAVGLGVLYFMSHRQPGGYTPALLTEAQRLAAEKRVFMQKLPQLANFANEAHAKASSASAAQGRGDAVPPDAAKPLAPVTVAFTQDEINATLWKRTEQYKPTYERYFTKPFIALEENAIVLMGTLPEVDRVASAFFEPKIDDKGMLRCDLTSLKLGSLPLPEGLVVKHRQKVEGALKARIPDWQAKAKMEPSGVTNSDARAAALGKLVLHLLNREPSPAVLFLPKDWERPNKGSVPVRLTKVAVEKGELTITVQPMDADERTALLEKIRQPLQKPGADAAAAELPKG
jgi:hypothetical protein